MIYNRFIVPSPVKPPIKEPNPEIEQYYNVKHEEVVLDPELDPDPFCLFDTPIHERLVAMGWPENQLPYIREKNC